MSLVILKGAIIDIAVCVVPYPFPMHLAFLKLTFIPTKIRPFHHPIPLQLILTKLPYINLPTIHKVIFALSMKLSLQKVSLVSRPFKFKLAFASFLTLVKIALVLYGIEVPQLETLTVLEVVFPGATVEGAFVVTEDSLAMSFTVLPLPLVDVAVCVGHTPNAVEKSVFCLALVLGAILEDDDAKSTPFYFGGGFFVPVADVPAPFANFFRFSVPNEVLKGFLGQDMV